MRTGSDWRFLLILQMRTGSDSISSDQDRTRTEIFHSPLISAMQTPEVDKKRSFRLHGGGLRMFLWMRSPKISSSAEWRSSFFLFIFFAHLKLMVASIFLAKFHGGFVLLTQHWAFYGQKFVFASRVRDEHWTGSGLWQILFILDWTRTVKCSIILSSGPQLDWVNGKELRSFCRWKLYFVNFLDFIWTWILNFLTFLA